MIGKNIDYKGVSKRPLVSVIIPVYNREDLVRETLDSVLRQTYENWECLVVDDGSADRTQQVVQGYVMRDNRFRLIVRDVAKKGASVCRNIGAQKANGEYLIFLDSDDLLAPRCLTNRVKVAREHSEEDFWVFGSLDFHNKIGDSDIVWNVDKQIPDIDRFLTMDVPWPISGVLWKVDSFQKLGGFKEDTVAWQDWELHTRAVLHGFRYRKMCIADHFIRIGNDKKISSTPWNFEKIDSVVEAVLSMYKTYPDLKSYGKKIRTILVFLLSMCPERRCVKFLMKVVKTGILKPNEILMLFLLFHWPLQRGRGRFFRNLIRVFQVGTYKNLFDQETVHKKAIPEHWIALG